MNFAKKEKVTSLKGLAMNATTIIAADTVCSGQIESGNDLRVDGTIEGNIGCQSKVVIGAGGMIRGNIHCGQADITGEVVGNITSLESLILRKGARVVGDIRTPLLQMESGVHFDGHCRMGQAKTDTDPGKVTIEEKERLSEYAN